MIKNHNHIDNSLERLLGDEPSAGGGSYQTLLDEGLALHQAFVNIGDAALRKSVIALAVECTKSEKRGLFLI